MKREYIAILVTCASIAEAREIIDSLLKKRLIACGNVVRDVMSKFWWNGKIDKAHEALIILKTQKRLFKNVEREVKRLNSYDLPEITALPIVAGSADYLKWIDSCVRSFGS